MGLMSLELWYNFYTWNPALGSLKWQINFSSQSGNYLEKIQCQCVPVLPFENKETEFFVLSPDNFKNLLWLLPEENLLKHQEFLFYQFHFRQKRHLFKPKQIYLVSMMRMELLAN
jgi:hypothetical protein